MNSIWNNILQNTQFCRSCSDLCDKSWLEYKCKLLSKKLCLQGLRGWSESEGISSLIPMLKIINWKWKIAEHLYLQGRGGWSVSERISCETQLIMHYFDLWGKYKSWFLPQYLIHKKLLNRLYLQGVRGCSESEGISYQTPILRIKKLLLRGQFRNKKMLSENLKV